MKAILSILLLRLRLLLRRPVPGTATLPTVTNIAGAGATATFLRRIWNGTTRWSWASKNSPSSKNPSEKSPASIVRAKHKSEGLAQIARRPLPQRTPPGQFAHHPTDDRPGSQINSPGFHGKSRCTEVLTVWLPAAQQSSAG